jgi:hypothetical protein
MTLEELNKIFEYQTTATDDYTPSDTIDYVVIDVVAQTKITVRHPIKDMLDLVSKLAGYQHDAYYDKIPVFIKPEQIVLL